MENKDKPSMEELQRKFYGALTWYFSEKYKPDSFLGALNRIHDELTALNSNLKESSESSYGLTKALNKLTFWGVLIAGLGVLTAMGHLLFELYKYFK
jgi:hypothetical protein